jgi:rare lipoprotein A
MADRRYLKPLLPFALLALAACGRQAAEAQQASSAAEAQASAPKRHAPPAQNGVASYYGPEFAGQETASGEPHDPTEMVAASRTLPLGAKARVTNKETGKSVAVEVNDRGPYAKGRIIDVSPRAAAKLGMKKDGTAPVKVQPVSAPPAGGN